MGNLLDEEGIAIIVDRVPRNASGTYDRLLLVMFIGNSTHDSTSKNI